MSYVTSLYIQFCVCDEENVPEVNRLLAVSDHRKQQVAQVDDYAGGNKHPQTVMLAAGMNYWTKDEIKTFLASLRQLPWKYPHLFVMLTYIEQSDEVKVWRLHHSESKTDSKN